MGMSMGMDVLVSLGVAGRDWAGWVGWLIRCYNDMICPRGGGIWAGKWTLPVWNRVDYNLLGARSANCVLKQTEDEEAVENVRRRCEGMDAIPFNSIQFSPVRPSPGYRRGAHQFVVNLGWPFILLSSPAERGAWACAAARTVGITHSLGLGLGWGGRG